MPGLGKTLRAQEKPFICELSYLESVEDRIISCINAVR